MARSVEEGPLNIHQGPGGGESFVMWMATIADIFTPWGTSVMRRDLELRDWWHTETILAGAIYTVTAANAGFKWKLTGPPATTKAVQDVLNMADMKGWRTFIQKLSTDLYCLYGRSTISLGGARLGQRKTIKEMVEERDPGPVLSLDMDGYISERPVIQWEKTPLGDRKWIWLSTKNTYQHSGKKRGGALADE